MATTQAIDGVARGAIVGLIGILSILWVIGGTCSATDFLFSHPFLSFAGTPPEGYGASWLGTQCEVDPSPLRTWTMLWGPICVSVLIAGGFAMHRAGTRLAGTLAGALAGLVSISIGIYSHLWVRPLGWTPALRLAAIAAALVIVAAFLGFLGALIRQRHA